MCCKKDPMGGGKSGILTFHKFPCTLDMSNEIYYYCHEFIFSSPTIKDSDSVLRRTSS